MPEFGTFSTLFCAFANCWCRQRQARRFGRAIVRRARCHCPSTAATGALACRKFLWCAAQGTPCTAEMIQLPSCPPARLTPLHCIQQGNLDFRLTEADVECAFAQFGDVKQVINHTLRRGFPPLDHFLSIVLLQILLSDSSCAGQSAERQCRWRKQGLLFCQVRGST